MAVAICIILVVRPSHSIVNGQVGCKLKKISEHLPQSLRFTYSNTPPTTTTTTTNTNNIMTQTGTEKAKEAAAAANVQGHAVAADLQAKVHTMLLPQLLYSL
jgi:hypothetical protein